MTEPQKADLATGLFGMIGGLFNGAGQAGRPSNAWPVPAHLVPAPRQGAAGQAPDPQGEDGPEVKPLALRLMEWAATERGWKSSFWCVADHQSNRPVRFRVGPVKGAGRTSNEAINDCADKLAAAHGWPDDRGAQHGPPQRQVQEGRRIARLYALSDKHLPPLGTLGAQIVETVRLLDDVRRKAEEEGW